jgi:nitrite reductase (NADH) large subunit
MSSTARPIVVVVGNGMVGHRFCARLKSTGLFRIVLFGEEPRPAYDRVHLSEYFSGKTAADLSLPMTGWFEDEEIVLHLGDPHPGDRPGTPGRPFPEGAYAAL